jgi:choline-sulfatase
MNRLFSIIVFVGITIISGCNSFKKEPNIVFVICDQMSPRAMGWTGETEVLTPCLDKLSQSGYCFTNAYCTSPVCAPARHSLYTGVYPSRHWVLKNDMKMRDDIPTIISMLNAHGYTTANIGKMHNAPYHHRRDFQYVLNHEFFTGSAGISHYDAYLQTELEQRDIKYNPYEHVKEGKIWLQEKDGIAFVNPLPEELTPENWMTREALKFIDDQKENRSEKPFFLHLSYFPPHHPYAPVMKYADMYLDKLNQLKLPPNFSFDDLQKWCKGSPSRPDSLSIQDVKYFRALYFGFVTQLDVALGELFEGMEERGLMENTIIVFTSDHGDNLGEHGQFYKGNMLEASVGVPLIIHMPGNKLKERKIITENVSHVDLVATLLEASGIPKSEHMAGYDMLPLMKGKQNWKNHSVFSEYYTSGPNPTKLMLRKGDYKLTYNAETGYGMFEMKLFNIREDPWEQNDLSENPEYAVQMMEMSDELMNGYWKEIANFLPKKIPQKIPRVKYDISCPLDPWKPVKIKK